MFFTQITFFSKFGTVMFLTMFLSTVFSMLPLPAALMEIGLRMKDKMWKDCRDLNGGSNIAEDEYGEMLQTFIEYSANEKVRVCPPECVSWVKK